MDRALKERIIGAVVLVAIAVLVVPVFLDGPVTPDDRMVSEPVLLPGQSREPGERRTVVLDRDRDQPLPETASPDRARGTPTAVATAGPAAAESGPARDAAPDAGKAAATPPAAGPDAGTSKPADEADPAEETVAQRAAPAPREEPPAKADKPPAADREPEPSATGMWAVQLGSFSNKANAERLAASLREDGYAAFLSRHSTASGELHRVRIGPQKDRASAEAVAAKLSAAGLKGQVVPHP